MVKAAFDPRNITLYLKPRHLIHFEWQSSNKIYRYALVEVIDPQDINEKSKQKKDEIGLTQEEIWNKKYAKNNISIK
jgi:hypothetical protein